MAVPKKKHSKQRSKVRYSAWKTKQQKKILNKINIVTCSNCEERIPERTICHVCGYYKGIQMILPKVSSNVNVIKV